VVGPSSLEAMAGATGNDGALKGARLPGRECKIFETRSPTAIGHPSKRAEQQVKESSAFPPALPVPGDLPPRRRAVRLAVAMFAMCGALVAYAPPTPSHESEQYTLPVGRNFADLGPYFSRIAYDAIVGAVAETNAEITARLEGGQTAVHLDDLQTSDYIAGKVWGHLFAAIPANELLDATLISESVMAQFPGLVTMYRPVDSIYDDPLLVIDLSKAVRTFFRAGTVSAGGVEFGTDKIIHFINVGRIYHSKYEARLKRGLPEEEAIKSAIASTSRNPLTSEDGVLGMMTTGIVSNGDLAADYAGLQFYRNLTKPIRIGSRTLPPMLVRNGDLWQVQVKPDSGFFTAFITPHWNEALNPNKFARYTSGRLRTLVRERCPDALDWYRDEHGIPRVRKQFQAIEQDLATYYGADYGHQSGARSPVTLASVCFADDTGTATAAPPPGRDAYGRSELWWAARKGDAARVKKLAVSPSEINDADVDGETALHAAVRSGDADTVQELVARGAEVNRTALYGVTPLMLAAAGSATDVAAVLLKASANPNSRDLFGKTPLHDAALRGNARLTAALLKHGADPRISDDGGNTPLHLAARNGNDEIATLLFGRGADLQARNAVGATARDEARAQGQRAMEKRLAALAGAGPSGSRDGRSGASALAYRSSEPVRSDDAGPPAADEE
jgi:ankyrin repeat protein